MVMASTLSLARSSIWGSSLVAAPPATNATTSRGPLLVQAKRQIEGKVVSTVRDKTVTVEVTRIVPDPKSKRRVRHTNKLHAHDPENACKLGDVVTLAMCKPISKTKHFVVVEVQDLQLKRRPPKVESTAEEIAQPVPVAGT